MYKDLWAYFTALSDMTHHILDIFFHNHLPTHCFLQGINKNSVAGVVGGRRRGKGIMEE
jgi:hypothetical protein